MGSLSNLSVLETRFYNIFQNTIRASIEKLLKSKLKVSLRRMKLPRRAVILKIARVYRCYASQVWIGIRMSNGLHLSRKNLSYYE